MELHELVSRIQRWKAREQGGELEAIPEHANDTNGETIEEAVPDAALAMAESVTDSVPPESVTVGDIVDEEPTPPPLPVDDAFATEPEESPEPVASDANLYGGVEEDGTANMENAFLDASPMDDLSAESDNDELSDEDSLVGTFEVEDVNQGEDVADSTTEIELDSAEELEVPED